MQNYNVLHHVNHLMYILQLVTTKYDNIKVDNIITRTKQLLQNVQRDISKKFVQNAKSFHYNDNRKTC